MKLVSFQSGDKIHPGVVRDNQVLDLGEQFSSVLEIIEGGSPSLERISNLMNNARRWTPLKDLNLLAPIPNVRRNVFCVGWNYLEHYNEGVGRRQELERELPEFPAFFTKATTSVNGPYDKIHHVPKVSDNLDYEGELAVVIGRQGLNIPEVEAMKYVFGYMVANDISARDLQRKHGGQWFKGKSLDTSAPMGPWIVTADEIADVQNLNIESRLNGEVVQSSNTKYMIFSVARLISELSKGMTLLPGDILLTGTPDGVGWLRQPPVFLRDGDQIAVTIEGIGTILNPVVTIAE